MRTRPATRQILVDFVRRLDTAFARPGRLYLVGETTQLFEGWREWATQIECAVDVAPEHEKRFAATVEEVQKGLGVAVVVESPAEVIPMPEGYASRARPIDAGRLGGASPGPEHLTLYHFDAYSVCFRFIARGDEPDYHMVLLFLDRGWVTLDEMNAKLQALLPRFTAETIQQDPAEFRRKYKGLLQMHRAVRARTTHRPTAV